MIATCSILSHHLDDLLLTHQPDTSLASTTFYLSPMVAGGKLVRVRAMRAGEVDRGHVSELYWLVVVSLLHSLHPTPPARRPGKETAWRLVVGLPGLCAGLVNPGYAVR
jgi:hypothetical protein